MIRRDKSDRRMRHKRDMAAVRGSDRSKTRQLERSGVDGVKRRIDRPFEPRNSRQVGESGC